MQVVPTTPAWIRKGCCFVSCTTQWMQRHTSSNLENVITTSLCPSQFCLQHQVPEVIKGVDPKIILNKRTVQYLS